MAFKKALVFSLLTFSKSAATATRRAAFITGSKRDISSLAIISKPIVEPLAAASSLSEDGINVSHLPAREGGGGCASPSVVVERVFATDERPIILFDGVCNLCNGAVNLALDWDPSGRLRFAALQSLVGRSLLQANGRDADDISSIVLVTPDGAWIKSDAILRITEALTPLPLLPLKPAAVLGRYVVPRFLRDLIYDGVADNRYDIMGKQDYCRFDADGEFEDRFVNDDLALRQQPEN